MGKNERYIEIKGTDVKKKKRNAKVGKEHYYKRKIYIESIFLNVLESINPLEMKYCFESYLSLIPSV